MKKHILAQLQALESEALAEALYNLAKQSDEAKWVVERLTRTSEEAYKATKRAISALKRSTRCVDWRDVQSFTRKLENIVKDINELQITDEQRFDLICRFFETEEVTFSRVDDSSGYVQDVYRVSAQAVFNRCARHVAAINPALISKELELLLQLNDYGLRDCLLDEVVSYLDDATNRYLISRFSVLSDQVTDLYEAKLWLGYIMQIAKHLKDTKLYELKALESVADSDQIPISTKYEIASNYYHCDDFKQAKVWIDKIDASSQLRFAEHNQFLVALHSKIGNYAERDRIARNDFDRNPSALALEQLLTTIGEEHRAAIVAEQLEKMSDEKQFSDTSLAFLLDIEHPDLGSEYIIRTRESINGDHYWHLPKQAAFFLKAGHSLAAICIYRALLDSILRRGKTKTYSYGVRYLISLDKLSHTVLVEGMDDHEAYKRSLISAHGKKHSFWRRYEERNNISTPVAQATFSN